MNKKNRLLIMLITTNFARSIFASVPLSPLNPQGHFATEGQWFSHEGSPYLPPRTPLASKAKIEEEDALDLDIELCKIQDCDLDTPPLTPRAAANKVQKEDVATQSIPHPSLLPVLTVPDQLIAMPKSLKTSPSSKALRNLSKSPPIPIRQNGVIATVKGPRDNISELMKKYPPASVQLQLFVEPQQGFEQQFHQTLNIIDKTTCHTSLKTLLHFF